MGMDNSSCRMKCQHSHMDYKFIMARSTQSLQNWSVKDIKGMIQCHSLHHEINTSKELSCRVRKRGKCRVFFGKEKQAKSK